MKNIAIFLDFVNNYSGLAEWVTAITAVCALIYAIEEYLLKRRPYIGIEIEIAENPNKQQGGWLFYAKLINKGTYPGIARIKKTKMIVGDEIYPNQVRTRFVLWPGESKKSALIGSIYKTGIDKIIGHEYRTNRAEIEIQVDSTEIGKKKMKYITKVSYEVDVKNEKPVILLIRESFK